MKEEDEPAVWPEILSFIFLVVFLVMAFFSLYTVTEEGAERRIIQAVTQCTDMIKQHQEETR